MLKHKVLELAVKRAMQRGYKPTGVLAMGLHGEPGAKYPPKIYKQLAELDSWQPYLYDHKFAQALWGTEPHELSTYCDKCGLINETETEFCWQYHLQQMVVDTNPFKYLQEHYNDGREKKN